MDTAAELRRAGSKRRKLLDDLEATSERVRELAVAALREGIAPSDVTKWSGYSHAQVRNMARAAGLPPARPGRKAEA